MIRLTGPGQVLFAIGFAGLGILSLVYRDFALQWQPLPAGIPARESLALASGALLLTAAVGLLAKRGASIAALVLALYLFGSVLVLHAPQALAHPANIALWSALCESLALGAGGWVLYAWIEEREHRSVARPGAGTTGVLCGRILFAIALIVFAAAHFKYADFTASMIPAWIPGRLPLAYITGAAHAAAGTALLLGIVPRLAARLEAIMMSSFVLLLHVPAVSAQPTNREQWTALCMATALAGAAWTLAGSFGAKFRPHAA